MLPGFTVEVAPTIDSTNSELMRRLRAGRCSPTLLVAQCQTAGRGRLGRAWHGDNAIGAGVPGQAAGIQQPPGSLTFSLSLALSPQDWSGLSLAVGATVADGLHPDLRLKWPNDIWLDNRKLAGILIETAVCGALRYPVIGVGINILPRDPAGLATPPACLNELLPGLDGPAVLGRLVPALVRALQLFEAQGFGPFQRAFKARDLLYGRAVVLSDGTRGTARGVDESGALLVHTSAGMKVITSAEVSVRPVGPLPGPAVAARPNGLGPS